MGCPFKRFGWRVERIISVVEDVVVDVVVGIVEGAMVGYLRLRTSWGHGVRITSN